MKNDGTAKNRGFTLIEMVLVIAILGLLAVMALPQFYSIVMTEARANARDQMVSSVQAGLMVYGSSELAANRALSFPSLLESTDLADGTRASQTNMMFDSVLQNGVSAHWTKLDDDCYSFDSNGNSSFDDGTDEEYQYNSTLGTFLLVNDCGS